MNNIGLVEHCKMALSQRWGYVWGSFGRVLTRDNYNQLYRQYPREVGRYADHIQANWLNRRCADCVGLIKSYLWWSDGNIRYNGSQDTTADGMYNLSKRKGPISTLPEVPGLALWRPGHIGVY
ncbi:MAG: hypothetical protein GXZ11_05555, partial [Tissierellia bacterium]|nr:hypothetical protein [Tissierellia bacterium]